MPEPVLISIAAVLATKTAGSLYDLVKKKFEARAEAKKALEAAKGTEKDSPEVAALAEHLSLEAVRDPDFDAALRAEWRSLTVDQHAETDGIANNVGSAVDSKVVQARDIQGNVSF